MIKKIIIAISTIFIMAVICKKYIIIYLYNNLSPPEYRVICKKYAQEYGLDHRLIYALIREESRFNPEAVSPRGAIGLMQIMPATAQEVAKKLKIKNFSTEMLYIPEINVKIGCFYLSHLMKRFDNNLNIALAAYNCGLNKIKRWRVTTIEQIPYLETREFVYKVLRIYRFIKVLDALTRK